MDCMLPVAWSVCLDIGRKYAGAVTGSMNMAGQVLRDLVLERETELTDLFFVNRRVVPLPPEPLRFALAEAIRGGLRAQDAWEARR